ncbi:hypothetical protein M8C21_017127 [Ambrosia artemisiifolia]|uniref:Uncharacterized protein n=1 Tax=Ambrosia artemisiifolia TaxID=4212 RepID=A0AAD5DA46_AMBAR|nr:hypothetical protein M8C21_017127 [Ambrosia artemisiifolia]
MFALLPTDFEQSMVTTDDVAPQNKKGRQGALLLSAELAVGYDTSVYDVGVDRDGTDVVKPNDFSLVVLSYELAVGYDASVNDSLVDCHAIASSLLPVLRLSVFVLLIVALRIWYDSGGNTFIKGRMGFKSGVWTTQYMLSHISLHEDMNLLGRGCLIMNCINCNRIRLMRFAGYFGGPFASINSSQFPSMKALKEAATTRQDGWCLSL